jgi:CBS domain-containing protein
MARTVREVMTGSPVCLSPQTTLPDAARQMDEHDIGDVLVVDNDKLVGMVTDRDIVVRAIAQGRDPSSTTLGEISTGDLVTVDADDQVSRAVELMREHAVRRLPVVEGGRPVGIVSIGDLAVEEDSTSALADISAAPSNN